ncbi:unnamed protein product [Linum trigynum]|uniref:Agglutinin domain-containing protein n=1 Tax=Linum trigynum TaxID=586398 RepID=A0AAV2DV09_9ROSI
MAIVAGLPQYVVLRSRRDGDYMHYLWNEEFGEMQRCMGAKREVDPVSPFVKLEVVPSAINPSSYVHLRCSYNNKFLQLKHMTWYWVAAIADAPNENISDAVNCTLFQPFFPSDQPPNTVGFNYVPNQKRVYLANESAGNPDMFRVALVYGPEEAWTSYFEFAPWESYEDKMRAKDDVIQAREADIARLAAQVAAKDEEIRDFQGQLAEKEEEILNLRGQVASWEAYEEEMKAKLEAEMLTLQSGVGLAWDSFDGNVTAGIGPKSIIGLKIN